jgi:hypothetical protein
MSKDVAALPHEPGDSHVYRIECSICGEPGMVRLTVDPERSDDPRVFIDPTAPETVAALAGALFDAIGWPTRKQAEPTAPFGYISSLPDGIVSGDGDNPAWAETAAAILPTFVARLRGKP